MKLGGWTRIWIALTVSWGLLCLWGYSRAVDQNIQAANKNFAEVSSTISACAAGASSSNPMSDDAIFAKFAHCESVPTVSAARSKHEAELNDARPVARDFAFSLFIWPVGVTGLCWAVVGWIRSGFKRRAHA